MGKKEKKSKKVNPKRERYAKFRKEKPSTMDVSMPELTEEENKARQQDDMKIGRHLRFSKNAPPTEVVARRALSKR